MFRFTTVIAPLCLLSLALSGCVDQTPDLENDDELVGEAADALSSQIGSNSVSSFEVPNGKKIVVSGGVVHAVFRSSGVVKYTFSSDGVSWSTAVNVDNIPGRDPSIAVAADGTVMVAYVKNAISGAGNITVAPLAPGQSLFGTPFTITSTTDANSSKTPSLVASGNTFHLSWARSPQIKYATFPSTQTASLASAATVATAFGTAALQPATMVGPGSSGPIVRVAFADYRPLTANNPHPPTGSLTLAVRELVGASWSQVYLDSATFFSAAQLSSVSADVNPTTGDAYVAVSRTVDGVGSTVLVRENTLTPGNSFVANQILTSAPLVSVAARIAGCQSRFRILTSTPITGHGSASYRTGTWTTGAAPTWIDAAPVSLPGTSRAGTALLQSLQISGSLNSNYFHGSYEENSGASFSLRLNYEVASTPPLCE